MFADKITSQGSLISFGSCCFKFFRLIELKLNLSYFTVNNFFEFVKKQKIVGETENKPSVKNRGNWETEQRN